MAAFGIHTARVEGDRLVVEGRCYSGVISLAQVFTRSYPPNDEERAAALHLTVEGISAYGHNLDQIEEGLTAEIQFSGEFPEALVEGWVLSTD